MGTQYRYDPTPTQNNDFGQRRGKKLTTKRNTSFTSPSVSYTNRITCPARQSFYKNMEDINSFTHAPKPIKKRIIKAASNTCPMHCRNSFLDHDKRDNDERPMGRNTGFSNKPVVGKPNRTSIQRQILSQALFKQQQDYENSLKKPLMGHAKKKSPVNRYPSQGTYPTQPQPVTKTSESAQGFCKVAKVNTGVYNANENLSSTLKYGVFNNCRRRRPRLPPRSVTVMHCQSTPATPARYPTTPTTPARYPTTPALENPHKRDKKVYPPRTNPPKRGPPPNSPIYAYQITEDRDTRFLVKSKILHIDIKPNIYRNFTPRNSNTACKYPSNDFFKPRRRSPSRCTRDSANNWFLKKPQPKEIFSPTLRSLSSFHPIPTCCNIHGRLSNNNVNPKSNYESFNRNVSSPFHKPNRIVSMTNRISSTITKNNSHRDFKRQDSPRKMRKNCNNTERFDKSRSTKYMHRIVLSSDNVGSSIHCNKCSISPSAMSPRKSSVSSTYRTISPEFCLSPLNLSMPVDCKLVRPKNSLPTMSETLTD